MNRQEISEKTGFDRGELFNSPDEVRRYFTTTSMEEMYGGDLRADYPELADQNALNEMADMVIRNGWHISEIKQLKCLRCGRTWWPRSPQKPKFCPSCNSPYWDKPRRLREGLPKV